MLHCSSIRVRVVSLAFVFLADRFVFLVDIFNFVFFNLQL